MRRKSVVLRCSWLLEGQLQFGPGSEKAGSEIGGRFSSRFMNEEPGVNGRKLEAPGTNVVWHTLCLLRWDQQLQ